jgi:hypothetical protein
VLSHSEPSATPLPDIPSVSEVLPAFRKPSTWFGFWSSASSPEILARLSFEMRGGYRVRGTHQARSADLVIIADTRMSLRLCKTGIYSSARSLKRGRN